MTGDSGLRRIATPMGLPDGAWQAFANRALTEPLRPGAGGGKGALTARLLRGDRPQTDPAVGPERFLTLGNSGGGDCLYHALAGRQLFVQELVALRRLIAAQASRMGRTPAENAVFTVAALVATPLTRPLAADLMTGRPYVSPQTLAALQRVRGIYAGDAELAQASLALGRPILRICTQSGVALFDQGHPAPPNFAPNTAGSEPRALHRHQSMSTQAVRQAMSGCCGQTLPDMQAWLADPDGLALLRHDGHWARIVGLAPG